MGWFVCCVRTWIGTHNCQRRAMRKTKSVHGSGCGWGDGFSEKRKSRNISLPSILSHRPSYIITATVTVLLSMTVGSWHPLSSYSEGILPLNIGFTIFLTAQTIFIRWIPIAFLALLHCLIIFFRCRHDTLPPGIFDTLALWSVQECKECMGVITEIYADTAALSAFSALSNSKMRIMQKVQMFFLFIAP